MGCRVALTQPEYALPLVEDEPQKLTAQGLAVMRQAPKCLRVYLLEDLLEHSHAGLVRCAGAEPLLHLQVVEDLGEEPAYHQPLVLTPHIRPVSTTASPPSKMGVPSPQAS